MARRDPYSRWNRLPPVYRSGEHKIPGPEDEPQRIILYLKGALLDIAELLAEKTGVATVQEYCADLLAKAIEVERVKHHVAEFEARRGRLEGFNEVTDDAGYLTEWQEQAGARGTHADGNEPADSDRNPLPGLRVPGEILDAVALPDGALADSASEAPPTASETGAADPPPRPTIRITPFRPLKGPVVLERIMPEVLDGTAIAILWSHVGPGHDLPDGFLPSLRRGLAVPPVRVAELLDALGRIETDQRNSTSIERRLSYALHRLSLESQVLLTEAWPGVFDEHTVGGIRAVQELVERILAGPPESDAGQGGEGATETHS